MTDREYDQMPQRLLPCPFCGGAAEWIYRDWDEARDVGDDGTGSITCSNSDCGVSMFGLERDSAEEQWNHRVLPYRVE